MTAVVACGALTLHIDAIARRRGWEIAVHPLPPALHNRPALIAPAVDALLAELAGQHERLAVAYADCGSGGAIDAVCERHGVARLPGLHCYDVLAGPRAAQLLAEEPGTYLLTDFLVRTFDALVWRGLGLDRYPELRDDYFKHYRRVVWLAQRPTAELHAAARHAAGRLELPLEIVETGEIGLESALADLVGIGDRNRDEAQG